MKYCAFNNGFYNDNTPDDNIPGAFVCIADSEAQRILDGQVDGHIQPGDDGFPLLVPYPELTKIEQQERAEQKRQTLKLIADSEISWRQDAVDAGISTDKEASELAGWKKYRVLLMRIDTATAPDINWPVKPE